MGTIEAADVSCRVCRSGSEAPEITMAFQPIVDARNGTIFGHEALVRGIDGAPAGEVLARVDDSNRFRFDQACRVRAIQQAAALGIRDVLSINFLPNAVYEPAACIRTTVATAAAVGFPLSRVMFEITEIEAVQDTGKLRDIVEDYRARSLLTAIDDFGAGHSGLNLLVDLLPDIVKLDMHLIRGVHTDPTRRTLVGGTAAMCRELGIRVIAEGIEEADEARCLLDLGIELHQGFLYARPAFDAIAEVSPEHRRP